MVILVPCSRASSASSARSRRSTGGDEGVRIILRAPATARGGQVGDSVALNGVCLTVTDVDGERLAFDAVPETLLADVARGARERARR